MSALRVVYLALTILGAAGPIMLALRGEWPAVPAGSSAFGIAALIVWSVAETWVRRNWTALLAIPVALILGIGCGLPLYLFLRTREVR